MVQLGLGAALLGLGLGCGLMCDGDGEAVVGVGGGGVGVGDADGDGEAEGDGAGDGVGDSDGDDGAVESGCVVTVAAGVVAALPCAVSMTPRITPPASSATRTDAATATADRKLTSSIHELIR